MSFVDFEPKPQPQQQPSFSSWLQEYWKQPHPHGLVAMLKAALNSIPDAVNGSIAATGTPPSTEEEAYRYNLARDRGAIGAFRAASTFGPSAPQFVGGASGRYVVGGSVPRALEKRVPSHLSGANESTPSVNLLPRPERSDGKLSGWPSSSGSVPSIPPPASTVAPSAGLLGRLRELETLERHTPITSTALASPEKDPNFRQLSRIVVRPLEVAPSVASRDNALRSSDPEAQNLEAISRPPQQDLETSNIYEQRADGSNFPGYGGKGGGPGKGGGGGKGGGQSNDDDDAHPCTQRWMDEVENWCPQFWRAGERWVSACEARAGDRNRLCWRNKGPPVPGEPDRYAWSDIPRKRIKPYSLRPKK